MNSNSANSYQAMPLIGRILIAAIFLVSGFSKLTAPGATIGYIGSLGLPAPLIGYLGSMALELLGSGKGFQRLEERCRRALNSKALVVELMCVWCWSGSAKGQGGEVSTEVDEPSLQDWRGNKIDFVQDED